MNVEEAKQYLKKLQEQGVNRLEQAKQLYKATNDSLFITAKAMNIKEITAMNYIQTHSWSDRRKYSKKYDKILRRKRRAKKIRKLVKEELTKWNLPLEWEEEANKTLLVYLSTKSTGRHLRMDVQSILQLLCRQHRIPTPEGLVKATVKGSGGHTRRKTGYMDALAVMNGVTPATPIDYVEYFCKENLLPKEIETRCSNLLKKAPRQWRMGRNPRVLAGALIYLASKGVANLTQHYISKKLNVTAVSLRERALELTDYLLGEDTLRRHL